MDTTTSVYLDLIRFLAAATVFMVHANFERVTGGIPGLWRIGDLGNDAVMVFFVLSGLVIAYVADAKEKTLQDYCVSRMARLYSVIVPALLLTMALDYAGTQISPQVYAGSWFQTDMPVWRIVANLLFTHELWFASIIPFSNVPFWSLGYEFWYYAAFATAYYLPSPVKYPTLAVLALLTGPKILILLPVWLLGVWAYSRISRKPVSETMGWLLFLGSVAAYAAFRLTDGPHRLFGWTAAWLGNDRAEALAWSKDFLSSYVIGMLVSLHFVGAAALAHRLEKPLAACAGTIRFLAGYTFAAYLFHYPLLHFFAAATRPLASHFFWLRVAIIICASVAAIGALGAVTERRKPVLKKRLLALAKRLPANGAGA